MRNPGGMQGIFANRPSTGAISLDNVIPLCHVLDTAGVFARSAATWSRVIKVWYPGFGNGANQSYTGYPRKIFYSRGSFPDVDTDAGALLEEFVVRLEKFLGVERTSADINSRWEETHAPGTPDTIVGLLNTVSLLSKSTYVLKLRYTDLRNPHLRRPIPLPSTTFLRRLRGKAQRPQTLHQPRPTRALALGPGKRRR